MRSIDQMLFARSRKIIHRSPMIYIVYLFYFNAGYMSIEVLHVDVFFNCKQLTFFNTLIHMISDILHLTS